MPSIKAHSFTEQSLGALALLKKGRDPSELDLEELRRELAQPHLVPGRDCVIAYLDGSPVGYVYLNVEPAISRGVLDFVVLEGYQGSGVADVLLDEALARARLQGLSLVNVDLSESDKTRLEFFESHEWVHVRTHLHLVRRSEVQPNVELPVGMTLRLANRLDAHAITELQNAAFTGSWGYSPNVVDEIAYRIFELPAYGPDPVVLLEEAGALVGYCWGHLEEKPGPGVVGMVGIAPERQGMGLGTAVTAGGVNALLDLGALPVHITVDSENPPAIRVYESLGFEAESRSFWYEMALSSVR